MNGLLMRALKEHVPLEMIYISASSQITQRRVLIKEINADTIRAYCYLRRQTRLFKIGNILSILPAKQSYPIIS